jgi:ribosomal protein S18 acetylase RimI-like enzyme
MAFDVMLKDQAAIRLYEATGCKRLGIIDHHHSDGKTEPAAVYVAPTNAIAR